MDASQVKTLTQLRKELSLTDASNITTIMRMFAKIAKAHPEIVKESFGTYTRSQADSTQNAMVEWYGDQAEYFKTLFNLD
jgi:predicted solute-binding protein